MIECIISRGLDAPAKFAPTLKVRKGNARYRRGQQRWKGESAYNPWTQHQSKELIYLLQKFRSHQKPKHYAHAPRGIYWQEKTITRPRPPLIRMHKPGTLHVSNLLHNFNHTCMLRDLLTSTQAFFKFIITQLA